MQLLNHLPAYAQKVNFYLMFQNIIDLIFWIIFYPASKMPPSGKKNCKKHRRRNKIWKLRPIHTLPLLCMNATTVYQNCRPLDPDAESIGIDNRASACISHCIDDFVSDMIPTNKTIIGYNNSKTCNLMMGTIRWKWTDDERLEHSHLIPESYYSPEGKCRLLSPQHWAQHQKEEAISITTKDAIILQWGNGKYKKRVPLGQKDNVATMYASPGYSKFHAFLTKADISSDHDEQPILCQEATSIIEDEEDDDDDYRHYETANSLNEELAKHDTFDVVQESEIATQLEMQQKLENRSAELLPFHCKYGHIPFQRLRSMAAQGLIPKYLVKTPPPACIACLYGRATKKKWRQRTPKHKKNKLSKPTAPGERVSVDMLNSPYPGLVAQMTGILTRKRYNYATVYIDNYSSFSYIHLQKSADIAETLESKRAFEMIASQYGVKIKSYHADNGIFRANGWTKDCTNKSQSLTFAGVNAHHQNGRAERRIRLLQELTRTQMIHLKHKWKAIEVAPLWPYAMRIANECLNNSPNMQHPSKLSAAQLFGTTEIDENPTHRQPFGAPTYVLKSPLQNNQPFRKWKDRSKLALYLGPSPFHARNVSLVMDLQTGLVSPQFHVVHDPTFSTVKNDSNKYYWSIKAGFTAHAAKQPVPQLRKTQTRKRGNLSADQQDRKRAKN